MIQVQESFLNFTKEYVFLEHAARDEGLLPIALYYVAYNRDVIMPGGKQHHTKHTLQEN